MNTYILRWNPTVSSYKKKSHLDLISHLKKGQVPSQFDWSVREWENLKKDDFFILQHVGTENDGIAMIGKFAGECEEGDSWRRDGTKVHYALMWIMETFDCDKKNVLPASRYEKLFPKIKWHGGHSGVLVEEKIGEKLIEQIKADLIKQKIWKEDSLENFMNYDFEAEFAAQVKTLLEIKKMVLAKRNDGNFVSLCVSLKKATVFVPMNVKMDDEDEKRIQKSFEHGEIKVGTQIHLKNGLHLVPDIIQSQGDGKFHFPVFSERSEIPEGYVENFSITPVCFTDCIKLAKHTKKVESIVLDAFTEPLEISFELADFIEGGVKER